MTMPSDVESPMYATASQEVRVADAAFGVAAFGVAAFGVAAFGDESAGTGAVVGGAAGAWSVWTLIAAVAIPEGGGDPLASAPMLITPARPAPSSARTPSAATEAIPAAIRRRRWRR